jgi:hypothetical protein
MVRGETSVCVLVSKLALSEPEEGLLTRPYLDSIELATNRAVKSVLKCCSFQHDIAITCITGLDGIFHRENLTWYATAEGQLLYTL